MYIVYRITFSIFFLSSVITLGSVPMLAMGQSTLSDIQAAIVAKEQEILKLQNELRVLRELYAQMESSAQAQTSTTQLGVASGSEGLVFIGRNLSRGSLGSDVELLQRALHARGYYPEAIFSGYYGPLTEEAVKRFQQAERIVSSGTPSTTGYGAVGPKTRQVLAGQSTSSPTTSSSGSASSPTGREWGSNYSSTTQRRESNSVYASPYAKSVSLHRGNARDDEVAEEYVYIDVERKAENPVLIRGWKLRSAITNRSITIGEIAQLFQFGRSGIKSPIVLSPGDRLIIHTGPSPLGQDSFRINKCSQYLNQFYRFNPSLGGGLSCPHPQEELIARGNIPLTDSCHDYVKRVSVCRVPDFTRFPVDLTPRCRAFLVDELNYNSCVRAHQSDVDFWGSEWRLYLGRRETLWRTTRETIELIDEFGNVIDSVSY